MTFHSLSLGKNGAVVESGLIARFAIHANDSKNDSGRERERQENFFSLNRYRWFRIVSLACYVTERKWRSQAERRREGDRRRRTRGLVVIPVRLNLIL